jgi:flagellar hook protein FlgE
MGIYGALSTAVTGLSAQSYALENISGNIANSQTVGYKGLNTAFQDMIPDTGSQSSTTAGSVQANAIETNDVQGDISTSQTASNMAINGQGFFVVSQNTGTSDGNPVFSGENYYTRQGDFDLDKNGYLVNSSGYYLEGLPIDSASGNVSGSVPSVIQVSDALLPAQPTTEINYQLNLPQQPQDDAYQSGVTGSELLQPADFLPAPAATTPATATGSTILTGTDDASTAMPAGTTLTVTAGSGSPITFNFYDSTVTSPAPTNGVDVAAGTTIDQALASIQSQLQTMGGSTASATVGLDSSGNVQMTLGSDLSDNLTVNDATGASGLGFGTQTVSATGPAATGPVNTISATDNSDFLAQSISGGAVTVYSSNGAPVDVELRWAKTDSAATGGTDSWSLYYMSNSAATGSQAMWTAVPQDYSFASDGSLSPAVTSTTVNNLTVNGVSLGNMTLNYGQNGITQFGDSSGTATETTLTQNGYAAGKFDSVSIDDSGRVIASYSNGQEIPVAQVVTATFNGENQLKAISGDAFEQTTASGSPIISTTPDITGSALEASNTDISTEFSQLIVTQQAYAAGTKVVTAANQMMQQALNMIQ